MRLHGVPDESAHDWYEAKDAMAHQEDMLARHARLQATHNDLIETRKQRERELDAAELEWKREEHLNREAMVRLEELKKRDE